MSIHSYTWTSMVDQLVGRGLRLDTSVGPLCAWAVYKLALYFAHEVEARAGMLGISVNFHVDDFCISGVGRNRLEAASRLQQAGAKLIVGAEQGKTWPSPLSILRR